MTYLRHTSRNGYAAQRFTVFKRVFTNSSKMVRKLKLRYSRILESLIPKGDYSVGHRKSEISLDVLESSLTDGRQAGTFFKKNLI